MSTTSTIPTSGPGIPATEDSDDPVPARSAQRATVSIRARWDDADGFGHVNNAAYLALMREAHDLAADALGDGTGPGRLVEVEIVYREPVLPGQTVEVRVARVDDALLGRRFRYLMSTNGRLRAELTATWGLAGGSAPATLSVPARDAGGRPFERLHVVRSHEVGPAGSVRPAVVLQWLEDAVLRSAARAGWDRTRMAAADFIALVIGHHLVLGAPAHEGDELTVTSRLIEARRVSGSWRHEVRLSEGSLVAVDHDRGAFVDAAGRLRVAPDGLIEDLLRGDQDEQRHEGDTPRGPDAPATK